MIQTFERYRIGAPSAGLCAVLAVGSVSRHSLPANFALHGVDPLIFPSACRPAQEGMLQVATGSWKVVFLVAAALNIVAAVMALVVLKPMRTKTMSRN
jgi:hypothetical protein